MSVQNETNRVQYWGNGSTGIAYPVPFYFFEASDLRVVVTDTAGTDAELTEGSDYSVAGAGNENGGSVLTASAVPATSRVTIYREVAAVQTTVYEENGEFPAKTHERALDRQTMLNQQNARAFDRALRVRESDGGKSTLTTVANSVIGFGGDSQPRTFTPEQLAVWLNLTQQVFGEGTKAWLTEADRTMAVPDFPGQVGVQLSDSTIWASNGMSAGSWTAPVGGIPDGHVTTAMLASEILSADSTGRAKMADYFLTLAKIGAGIFTADSLGRGKFASGFVDSGLCASGLWNAIAPSGTVLQTVSVVNTTPASMTAIVPPDSTKPQISEGTQILSASITPSSTSNKILCRYVGSANISASGLVLYSLHKSGVNDALQSGYGAMFSADACTGTAIEFIDSSASTSEQTYSIRMGPNAALTIYINRFWSNATLLGGALGQTLVLQEIKG